MRIFLLSSAALLVLLSCFAGDAPTTQPALPAKDIAAIKKLLVEYKNASFLYNVAKIAALISPDKEGNSAEYIKFLNNSDDVDKMRKIVSVMGMCPPEYDNIQVVTFRKTGKNTLKVGYCFPFYGKDKFAPGFQALKKKDGKYYVLLDKQDVESLKRGFEARTKSPQQISEETFKGLIKRIRGFDPQQLKEYQQEIIDELSDIVKIRKYAEHNKIELGVSKSIQDMQLEKDKMSQMSPDDFKQYMITDMELNIQPLARRAYDWLNLLSDAMYGQNKAAAEQKALSMLAVPFYCDKKSVCRDIDELKDYWRKNIENKRDRNSRRRKPHKMPKIALYKNPTSQPASGPTSRKCTSQPVSKPKLDLDFLESCCSARFTIAGDDEIITVWVNRETGMIQGIAD